TICEAAQAPWNKYGSSLLPVARKASARWEDVAFSEYCATETDPIPTAEPVIQRMMREGRYKLNYYHGLSPQLFDLKNDPDELTDLSEDPKHKPALDRLISRLKSDWNPEEVLTEIIERQRDNQIMRNWAEKTGPAETYRWDMPDGKAPGLARNK
ncbi:MAG: sulfatase/phosphatase domain-containing protein, partial [Rhizobiaceae bacterium]